MPQAVESLARAIGIDTEEIAERLAFLEFGSDDTRRLQALKTPLQDAWNVHADTFYAHLLDFDDTRAQLGAPEVMTRLRHAHSGYFQRLLEGAPDWRYVRDRLNVGLVHQRIGLAPKWYIGAYRKYIASLLPTLLAECERRGESAAAALDSLFKIVTFDICLAIDSYIDAEQQAQARAEARSRLRERAMESSTNGIFIVDIQRQEFPVIYANAAFYKLTGLPHRDDGELPCLCQHDRHRHSDCMAHIRQAVRSHREGYTVLAFTLSQGEQRWVELFASPVEDQDGANTHYIGILHDITERKQAERHLLHQATHDPLTGLANRYRMHQKLTQVTEQAERERIAVLFLDLDRFKLINDSLGHDTGDELLCQVAGRLKRCLRGNDTIARFGGDEFVILLDDITAPADARKVADKILAALDPHFAIQEHSLFVSTSIGISLYPEHGRDSQTLLKHADAAMYQAKAAGRNRVAFFSDALTQHATAKLSIENDLRLALEERQFCLHYQPIVDTRHKRLVGVEALLRWQHPHKGTIAPDAFIPQAEEAGLILPIGAWVIDRAIAQAAMWQHAGVRLPVSINLSVEECDPIRTAPLIRQALARHGLAPELLQIEITETVMMEQIERVLPMLEALKVLGVHLAMDDFGTGYSSLRRLRDLPLDTLKIDKSFITSITRQPADQAIVSAVISLARKLDIRVITEGVEQADQVAWLAREGCHIVQGYYYGKPVPPERLRLSWAQQN